MFQIRFSLQVQSLLGSLTASFHRSFSSHSAESKDIKSSWGSHLNLVTSLCSQLIVFLSYIVPNSKQRHQFSLLMGWFLPVKAPFTLFMALQCFVYVYLSFSQITPIKRSQSRPRCMYLAMVSIESEIILGLKMFWIFSTSPKILIWAAAQHPGLFLASLHRQLPSKLFGKISTAQFQNWL